MAFVRRDDVVVRVEGDEVLVLDLRSDVAHCLSGDVAQVWQAAGAETKAVALETGLSQDSVETALKSLQAIDLVTLSSGPGRRALLRGGMVVGGAAITTLALPAAAMANSGRTLTLSPTSGPKGTIVTVSGTGWTGTTISAVQIGALAVTPTPSAPAIASGSFSFTFVVPANAVVSTDSVSVTDNASHTETASFSVTAPTISLSPSSGPTGTSVTVTGSGFFNGTGRAISTVKINGTTVAPNNTTVSGTGTVSFTFTVPTTAGLTLGTGYDVTVTDSKGNAATDTFTIAPVISVSPSSGPTGTSVTVTGNGFFNGTGRAISTVTINGTTVTSSNTTISGTGTVSFTFTVPTSAGLTAGDYDVTVTDNHGNAATDTFTVTPKVTLSDTHLGPPSNTFTVTTNSPFAANSLVTVSISGTGGAWSLSASPNTAAAQTTNASGTFPASTTYTVSSPSGTGHTATITFADASGNTTSVSVNDN